MNTIHDEKFETFYIFLIGENRHQNHYKGNGSTEEPPNSSINFHQMAELYLNCRSMSASLPLGLGGKSGTHILIDLRES